MDYQTYTSLRLNINKTCKNWTTLKADRSYKLEKKNEGAVRNLIALLLVIFALVIGASVIGDLMHEKSSSTAVVASSSNSDDEEDYDYDDNDDYSSSSSSYSSSSSSFSSSSYSYSSSSPSISREYRNALETAKSYLKYSSFSEKGLYEQLTSEYGEQFPADAAQYAIDNCGADWNAEALESAKSYLEMDPMSDAELYEQLTSEYGEQFTPEQAQYALDNLPQ